MGVRIRKNYFSYTNSRPAYCLWSSLVNIVSGYRLHDRGSILAEAKGFSSRCVQTTSEAHRASYPMGTGGKARPGRDADHSSLLVPRSRMSRSYTSSAPCSRHSEWGDSVLVLQGLCSHTMSSISQNKNYMWPFNSRN
jgi:hypothetical protein